MVAGLRKSIAVSLSPSVCPFQLSLKINGENKLKKGKENKGASLLENHRRAPGSAECLSGFWNAFNKTPASLVLCHSLQLSALTRQAKRTQGHMVRVLQEDTNSEKSKNV